jgi:hypothetical protein
VAGPAALIGLLLVSVSIRIDVIAASPDFRNRGAATLSLFMSLLLVAILLVVPGQQAWQLGAELLILAAGPRRCAVVTQPTGGRSAKRAADLTHTGHRQSRHDHDDPPLRRRRAPARRHRRRGVRRVPAVIATIGGGVVSAWLFLTWVTA